MANPEHLEILKQGVEAWNQWREENRDVTPDLGGANLSRANLTDATLLQTIFADTDLSNAHGLETCRHLAPSTLDHRTLAKPSSPPVSAQPVSPQSPKARKTGRSSLCAD